ncbi:hypothetical protein DEU56DRAFT_905663 [Suillus clintonianus]|uniref:uncharacterized protein n=1 Tax=Suillus clintonianus TaxID=1904413 RepID=UPI001B8717BB|nr:uncharacterized protein DEU56DRAFT_905663 [Suillus clintonianus]KAG2156988.1 hypothetical protein DEU56DRAFT_905663 [Suillus clintonianus]
MARPPMAHSNGNALSMWAAKGPGLCVQEYFANAKMMPMNFVLPSSRQCGPNSSPPTLSDDFSPYSMDIDSMIPPPGEEGFSVSHVGDEVVIYQELEEPTTTTVKSCLFNLILLPAMAPFSAEDLFNTPPSSPAPSAAELPPQEPIETEADVLDCDWTALRDHLDTLTRMIPKDKEELLEDKEHWMRD